MFPNTKQKLELVQDLMKGEFSNYPCSATSAHTGLFDQVRYFEQFDCAPASNK